MHKCLGVLLLAVIASSEVCPPWTVPYSDPESNSTFCKCGASLRGVVDCNNETLQILDCYCMIFNSDLNMTLVGHCTVRCFHSGYSRFHVKSKESESLNDEFCQGYNREGQLCGKCMANYGPPVYSYSYLCVKCDKSRFKWNILKYIAVAFAPLTLFYLAVIVLKINATESFMVAYVMICQLQLTPFEVRRLVAKSHFFLNYRFNTHVKFTTTLFGIWNLDILRSIYTPFCIHPDMTTLQVLALDYLIGVYPLVLIACTYVTVKLHDKYPLVVKLCRPFSKLMCIKQEWDISGSLIQAFATFLVLSYVKILNVSFDLLTPVSLWTPEGKHLNQSYLYNAGETPYFGHEHLPYGVLAVVMLIVFNVLPVILLFLYPCSRCRKCLHCCHLNSPTLHTFMDTFQGCYHHKPRERRYFAAAFLILRALQAVLFVCVRDSTFSSFTAFFLVILAVGISILQPYRKQYQNWLDVLVLSMYAVYLYSNMVYGYAVIKESRSTRTYHGLVILFFTTALLYAYSIFVYGKILVPSKLVRRVKMFLKKFKKHSVKETFPHRLEQESEHSPLL